MTQINDGGPAFPRPPFYVGPDMAMQDYWHMQDGMRLRDYYAGQAIPTAYADVSRIQGGPPFSMELVGTRAVEIADAVIAALNR